MIRKDLNRKIEFFLKKLDRIQNSISRIEFVNALNLAQIRDLMLFSLCYQPSYYDLAEELSQWRPVFKDKTPVADKFNEVSNYSLKQKIVSLKKDYESFVYENEPTYVPTNELFYGLWKTYRIACEKADFNDVADNQLIIGSRLFDLLVEPSEIDLEDEYDAA